MRLDDMTGSFRQPDVAVHFVLGVLSWSSSLAGAAALERARRWSCCSVSSPSIRRCVRRCSAQRSSPGARVRRVVRRRC